MATALSRLGFGEAKRVNSPREGQLKESWPAADICANSALPMCKTVKVGQKIDVSLFKAGDLVDVSGISKGKGLPVE